MTVTTADILICGGGIAGIAAAYHLTVRQGVPRVLLVDERPLLSLTSDKSTEAYRNWWPGPDAAMRRLMNRSIDLLEELARASHNRFLLSRRGYVYATADPQRAAGMKAAALSATDMGDVRLHEPDGGAPLSACPYIPAAAEGFTGQPDGVDLLLDPALIRRHFSYLSPQTIAILHARRCGWFSGQQLGMYLWEQARQHGAELLPGRVTAVQLAQGRVARVTVQQESRAVDVNTAIFINAAGPLVNEVAALLGLELPIFHERHRKVSFRDHLGILPRHAPLLIWEDAQRLPWNQEEQEWLADSADTRWLLEPFPGGVHTRPEGSSDGQTILLLWAYHTAPATPIFPLPADPLFPELTLRGLSTMIPGLAAYFEQMPRPYVDGGYYTKTRENRLLSCPLPVPGAYVLGALSGYGLMAALAAAELLAAHIVGAALPDYAPAFDLRRYQDVAYLQEIAGWAGSLQL